MGLLPSAQGLGLGGFVARVPSEQVHVGATPSEHMGPLAKAEASMRVKRSWGSILTCGELNLCAGRQEGYAGVEKAGRLYTGEKEEATGCAKCVLQL